MTDHACLACGKIHPDAREVTLHDGTVVSSYSDAWRHESEAIAILNLKTKNDRWLFLSAVKRVRGQAAADELKKLAEKIYKIRVENYRAAG